MRFARFAGLAVTFAAFAFGIGCSAASSDASTTSGSDLVGGTRDTSQAAAGYLVEGATLDAVDLSHPACNATLIAPNVIVTAAHCVLRAPDAVWAFGTGDVGTGPLVQVASVTVDPEFHARPEGLVDIPYALRKNDVAYLVLASAIAGVTPAAIPSGPPASDCTERTFGYHADDAGDSVRMSTSACVEFSLSLGDDPIFEVHPTNDSGVCNTDGDEGSPLLGGTADAPTLVGFYVGSVSQTVTDCDKGTQFLDGYESAYGYRDFFAQGIAAGAARR